MGPDYERAFQALTPLLQRVRRDVTAARKPGQPAYWTNESLTPDRLKAHFGAGPWRGCCPINEGTDTTSVAVLDFDSHKGTCTTMLDTVLRVIDFGHIDGFYFQAFRSSGGNGIHLIALWETPQDAASVRSACSAVLAACGLRDGTGGVAKHEVEIFPKQDFVPTGGKGNMFVLPLAGRSVWLDPVWDYEPMDVGGLKWEFSVPVFVVPKADRTVSESGSVDPERVVSALMAIPNNDLDYDTYRNIGFAVCSALGTGGIDAFIAWSKQSAKHDDAETRRLWRDFKPAKVGGITAGTLFKMARDAGHVPENTATGMPSYEGAAPGVAPRRPLTLKDYLAHLPSHQYICLPTGELHPASSVDGHLVWQEVEGKRIRPSSHLDKHDAVLQMVYDPGEPQLIEGKIFQTAGWVSHPGARVYNKYRPPLPYEGDPEAADPWVRHVHKVYPDDAPHIIKFMAHRVQRPGEKINHALVLGGAPGIGKDTLFEPIKAAVGAWNVSEISPVQLTGAFNGWVQAVLVRISEARDLGELNKFGFYEHSKTIFAAPPNVLRVNEKHLRETYVANVCGVVLTTNHRDALYLPPDDRRHYVAWSPCTRDDFAAGYWSEIYRWFAAGGTGHVAAYLAALDLSDFDPKAPPLKTAAFWTIVAAGEAPESSEMRDVIDMMGNPAALTLKAMVDEIRKGCNFHGLIEELQDRKTRRALPHKFGRVGYVPARNPDAADGLFVIDGKRQAVYTKDDMPQAEQVRAARALACGGR